MQRGVFEELLGNPLEARAILRGHKKPSRRMIINSSGAAIAGEPRSRSRSLRV